MPKATPPTSWRVDERRVHRAADVGADDHALAARTTPVSGSTSSDDGARAARVGDLGHLERGAGGQPALGGQLGERDAPAARAAARRAA